MESSCRQIDRVGGLCIKYRLYASTVILTVVVMGGCVESETQFGSEKGEGRWEERYDSCFCLANMHAGKGMEIDSAFYRFRQVGVPPNCTSSINSILNTLAKVPQGDADDFNVDIDAGLAAVLPSYRDADGASFGCKEYFDYHVADLRCTFLFIDSLSMRDTVKSVANSLVVALAQRYMCNERELEDNGDIEELIDVNTGSGVKDLKIEWVLSGDTVCPRMRVVDSRVKVVLVALLEAEGTRRCQLLDSVLSVCGLAIQRRL